LIITHSDTHRQSDPDEEDLNPNDTSWVDQDYDDDGPKVLVKTTGTTARSRPTPRGLDPSGFEDVFEVREDDDC